MAGTGSICQDLPSEVSINSLVKEVSRGVQKPPDLEVPRILLTSWMIDVHNKYSAEIYSCSSMLSCRECCQSSLLHLPGGYKG